MENPAMINGDSDGSPTGWVDGGGDLPVGLRRRPLRQQQAAACSCGLANQQLLPAEQSCSPSSPLGKEEQEIDHLLCLQGEQLRVALLQQSQRRLLSLEKTVDTKATSLLRCKEEELARAGKVAAELEERLRQSEAEVRAWQTMARESEAMAQALSGAIEQVRSAACPPRAASPCDGAADSCCSTSPVGAGDPEAASGRCRSCGARRARVLFFPCMHLCACELCAALLAACPVCRCAKQGAMEVFMA